VKRRYARQVAMLAACGIDVPAWQVIEDEQALPDAAARLQAPLVVKSLAESAQHKTEQGLVHLRLRDLDEALAAARDVWSKMPGEPLLLQEMVEDVTEVLLTVRTDPDFGPIAAIGTGGVAVELLDDVAYLALPASPDEFRAAIEDLRLHHLLAGFRGRRPRDVVALTEGASRLGQFYIDHRNRIDEFEINPLGVRAVGEGVVALDVLEVPASATTAAEPAT